MAPAAPCCRVDGPFTFKKSCAPVWEPMLRVGLLNGPMGKGTVVAETEAQVELEVELAESEPPALPATLLVALPRPKSLKRVLQAAAAFGTKG